MECATPVVLPEIESDPQEKAEMFERYKLDYIQFTLTEMYDEGEKASRIFRKLKDIIARLFEQYSIWNPKPLEDSQEASMSSNVAPRSSIELSDSAALCLKTL
ncbi:hypothetical protein PIB30_060854 [Stylosanthes scabra]|uniref:Uncharacterized protein n=1 Tax=Stylosanthes scabra TaxID=79078 RepID=A0ABU6WP12_9FABA|nr:hypothetical protein [Stylosanthes scabra]